MKEVAISLAKSRIMAEEVYRLREKKWESRKKYQQERGKVLRKVQMEAQIIDKIK